MSVTEKKTFAKRKVAAKETVATAPKPLSIAQAMILLLVQKKYTDAQIIELATVECGDIKSWKPSFVRSKINTNEKFHKAFIGTLGSREQIVPIVKI